MATKITSKNLRTRFLIQRRILTADNQGGHSETWQDFDYVWGSFESLGQRGIAAFFATMQIQQEVSALLTIRYREDIQNSLTVDDRIVTAEGEAPRFFKILGFEPTQDHKFIVIKTREISA